MARIPAPPLLMLWLATSLWAAPAVFRIGGAENDYGKDVTVDGQGNIIVAGYVAGRADLDPGAGERAVTARPPADVCLVKLDGSGKFVWGFAVGGVAADMPHSVVCDGEGNIYVTGYFSAETWFDRARKAPPLRSAGKRDVFVAKYGADGSHRWSLGFGSAEDDEGMDLALDGRGGLYVTGVLRGAAQLDPRRGRGDVTGPGQENIFLAQYDTEGNYRWGFVLGGAGNDQGCAVRATGDGGAAVSGCFSGTVDFDPGAGEAKRSSRGETDVFVARYSAGGEFRWVQSFGGGQADFAAPGGMALDARGGVCITGRFRERIDFGAGAARTTCVSRGMEDVFVARFDAEGNPLRIVGFGGPRSDGGHRVALDSKGNIVVAGWFRDTAAFDPAGARGRLTARGKGEGSDAFVAKYDGEGRFLWAFRAGSAEAPPPGQPRMVMGAIAAGLALDASDRILCTGRFHGTADFSPDAGEERLVSAGGTDLFLLRLTPEGRLDAEAPTKK